MVLIRLIRSLASIFQVLEAPNPRPPKAANSVKPLGEASDLSRHVRMFPDAGPLGTASPDAGRTAREVPAFGANLRSDWT